MNPVMTHLKLPMVEICQVRTLRDNIEEIKHLNGGAAPETRLVLVLVLVLVVLQPRLDGRAACLDLELIQP